MLSKEYTSAGPVPDCRLIGRWFDELQLYVAPSCNMLCNFCSKGSDCISNGNNPTCLSRAMTPRQAVNWAELSVARDSRIKVVKITGPGEPLFNLQTFEVLKRLKPRLPGIIPAVSTNGLLLEEKAEELARLGVKMVDIAINAVSSDIMMKLYSKLILPGNVLAGTHEMARLLHKAQFEGLKKCLGLGMTVKINSVYFPGVNDEDILQVAKECISLGDVSMCIISGFPGGKLARLRPPALWEMSDLRNRVGRIIPEIQLKTFYQ